MINDFFSKVILRLVLSMLVLIWLCLPYLPASCLSLVELWPKHKIPSVNEVKALASHDIVLLVDKSKSMADADCPLDDGAPANDSKQSRWDWCYRHTLDLTRATQSILSHKIKVVLFSSSISVIENVDIKSIAELFERNVPSGGTNTTLAVKSQLDEYFARKIRHGGQVNPLLMAVITDGCPNNVYSLEAAIIDATKNMQRPDEISIVFFQVGQDSRAAKLFDSFENGRVTKKARYPIVSVIKFDQVMNTGLTRSLVDTIVSRQKSPS